MKKLMFFAIAAAGLLTSCTSDENFESEVSPLGQETVDDRVPIEIGIGKAASVKTRGTGTVGGLKDSIWNKQIVNVFMFNKNTLNLTHTDANDPTPLYRDVEFYTPDGVHTNRAIDVTKAIKYYPTTGRFDFWGYRIDDAERLDTIHGINNPKSTRATLDFKIDGSQDVMVAHAIADTSTTIGKRAFSAYSARNGVQPELTFKHLLSRLTFKIIAGNNDAMDPTTGIFVDSISIKSKSTGKLTIAYTPEDALAKIENADTLIAKYIEWNDTVAKKELFLKQRAAHAPGVRNDSLDLVKLVSIQPNSTTVGLPVGEALLVAPDASYDILVYMHQYKPTVEGGQNIIRKVFTAPDVVKLESGSFKPGYSYEVQIKLFGLSPIEITTTLKGWQDGGQISITPEDN